MAQTAPDRTRADPFSLTHSAPIIMAKKKRTMRGLSNIESYTSNCKFFGPRDVFWLVIVATLIIVQINLHNEEQEERLRVPVHLKTTLNLFNKSAKAESKFTLPSSDSAVAAVVTVNASSEVGLLQHKLVTGYNDELEGISGAPAQFVHRWASTHMKRVLSTSTPRLPSEIIFCWCGTQGQRDQQNGMELLFIYRAASLLPSTSVTVLRYSECADQSKQWQLLRRGIVQIIVSYECTYEGNPLAIRVEPAYNNTVRRIRPPPVKEEEKNKFVRNLAIGERTGDALVAAEIELRPFVMYLTGEVFWHDLYGKCNQYQHMMVYRARVMHKSSGCLQAHFVQVAEKLWNHFHLSKSVSTEWMPKLLPEKWHDRSRFEEILKQKSEFCAFLVSTVFKGSFYWPDALVRHALFRLISERKQCHNLGTFAHTGHSCPGSETNSPNCFHKYKFVLAAENTRMLGYMSEKILTALIGETVPIYFGAPDAEHYINGARFIHCDVSNETHVELRKAKKRGKGNKWTVAGIDSETLTPEQEQTLIAWAAELIREDVKPCIDRVMELDADDEKYLDVLSQPVFHGNSIEDSYLDGTEMACSLLRAMEIENAPLVAGFDVEQIENCANDTTYHGQRKK